MEAAEESQCRRRVSHRLLSVCVVALTLAPSCTRAEAIENIPTGTEVTVVTQDGTLVRGKIAKVEPELVTLTGERPNTTTEVTRTAITEVKRVDPKEADETARRARRRRVPR